MNTLQIYNTLNRRKEPLEPLEDNTVRMYVCGLTVYDYCHIGHARMLVVFDMVARYLRARGYRLTYVRNITDIDDKIIRRAAENGESIETLTERFIAATHEDERALGILPPDHEPRATQHIDGIVRMIETLVDKGAAYAADNGDVYYDVSEFDGYGRLSGKNPADLRAGARVEVDEAKADPLDFVLWKAAKPSEPAWDSPWGKGRPGWHIECSAMSTELLGDYFDIHGGGMDLQFPHHENEIAQSCAATGARFVKTWMHNGFVQVDDEKMSKSLGNFFTVRDVLKVYDPEVVRYFILNSHYRSPLNYSDHNLDGARAGLERFYLALRDTQPGDAPAETSEFAARFHAAMSDDFNTPVAIAALFDLAREINRLRDTDPRRGASLAAELRELAGILGILQAKPDSWLRHGGKAASSEGPSDAEIDAMLEARQTARKNRDFAEADRIRDELIAQGIQLEDKAGGKTEWRRG